MTTTIFAKHALTQDGWQENVTVTIGSNGQISAINTNSNDQIDTHVGVLLPAMSNLHCHSFQRALAGLGEHKSGTSNDNFWSWRKLMYQFLNILNADDVQAIAAKAQLDMLKCGYAAYAEFHYLHHRVDGRRYDQIDELSVRHFNAALETGIGYTHLPVLYMQSDINGQPLDAQQLRFGNTLDQFETLFSQLQTRIKMLPHDSVLGIAPHSLRAVNFDGMNAATRMVGDAPIHIHIAEQTHEVDTVLHALGERPVEWLLNHFDVNPSWCLVHATHMNDTEIRAVANSGAVVGICPMTEGNLGDGIFDGKKFIENQGIFGIGTDSNIKISLSEELRLLEISQRLRDQNRIVLCSQQQPSNGTFLYTETAKGGAQALGRNAGTIKIGALADLVALDDQHINLIGLPIKAVLDSWIFASDDSVISHVWSAGRHVIDNGYHAHQAHINNRYIATMVRLRQNL